MSGRSRIGDIKTMKTLFTSAEQAALGMGEDKPGPEHLVLAALDLPDGSARRSFDRLGADPDAFRDALAAQHAAALAAAGVEDTLDPHIPSPPRQPGGVYRTTGSAQEVFQQVVKLVRGERSRLYGAYIVLVSAQAEHGAVPRALLHMGLDRAAVAQAARAELDQLNG